MAETPEDYDGLRTALADALEAAAGAQEAGLLGNIGADYERFDALVPRGSDPRYRKLSETITFWDFWIDSSNHDWLYYASMTASSWPPLARSIASDLRADQDIRSDQVLILVRPQRNAAAKRQGLLSRLRSWARRRTRG